MEALMRTEEIVRVALPETADLSRVVLYLITKSGHYLNGSQAAWLVASGQVKLDGRVERRLHHVVSAGLHCVEVYGRLQPFEVMPVLKE
jgi:hypothetical protein